MATIGTDTFFATLAELNAGLKAGEFTAEDLARAFCRTAPPARPAI